MLSQGEIQERIEKLEDHIEALTDEIRAAGHDAAIDTAVVATADLRRAALLARNNLSTLREALAAAKTNMDGLRTLAASHRNIV